MSVRHVFNILIYFLYLIYSFLGVGLELTKTLFLYRKKTNENSRKIVFCLWCTLIIKFVFDVNSLSQIIWKTPTFNRRLKQTDFRHFT